MRAISICCRTGIALEKNERIHFCDLKDRYRQRRDRTRQLVAQLITLNSHKELTETEVRLLAKKLSKEDIRKYSRFEFLPLHYVTSRIR